MKKLIILAVVLIGISSCTKQTVSIYEKDIPEDIFYLKDHIRPFSGNCLIYYTGTKKIKESLNFKRGILNGEAISYYRCGTIKRKGYYRNGCLSGRWQSWDEKGF